MNIMRVLAKSLGYELVNRNKNPSLMFHLKDLIDINKIDLVLDVGGNTGQFAKSIRGAGYKGEIHSFEPVKNTFELLEQSADGDDSWHVHNFAMASEPGSASINVTKGSVFSSLLEPNEYGTERFKKNTVEYTETIKLSTVDHFLKSEIVDLEKRRIFLKTDTQGFDLEVLKGAQQSLELIHCLLSEISFIPIYTGMPSYLESLEAFGSYGFTTSGFYPITRNKTNLALIEMDCIMVKQKTS